ncbi:retrovirus-related pol polyprotein from transposon TNT 1-94, partial [Tanacetum coccineum]
QDNSTRINRGTGYDNQRAVNVAGARENKDDTDDESDDQELEAHYMYMAQIQEVTPDPDDNSGPIFDDEPMHKNKVTPISLLIHWIYVMIELRMTRMKFDDLDQECDLLASLIQKLKCEIDDNKNQNKFLESSNKALVDKLKGEIEDFKTKNKSLESSNNHFKQVNNELSKNNQLMFKDLNKFQAELDKYNGVNYASKVEIDSAKAKGDLMSYKINFKKSSNAYTRQINDLNQTNLDMKKELCAHQETISIMSQAKEAQIKLYKTREDKELDKVITLENKVRVLNDFVYKTAQSVQTMNMLNRNYNTSFAKPEFLKKAQRVNPCLYDIGKLATFSDSLAKKDFSKSKSVTKNDVSEDFSKPVIAQILPQNVKSILKNTHVIAPRMYKVYTKHNQTRTPQFPQDIRKTNKRVSFSTGVIPTISVSRPQLKSNQLEDRVMNNNSQGKKTVASESTNNKTRSIDRKLYEHVSKTCSWWYPKFTPSGYNWKPKSSTMNVTPNVSMPLARRGNSIHLRLWVLKAHDEKSQASNSRKCHYQEGNDLLTGSRGTNLYSITLQDTSTPNPICLMDKASSSQAWLWHRRLSHLNFDTINLLSMYDIVTGLPKLKFVKDHLCSSCESRKAKHETPEVLIDFLKLVQRGLHAQAQSQEHVPQAAETVTTSNEMDLLFSLMFDELLNGTTLVVSKSSAVIATDAPNQRQHHNTTSSTSTTVAADIPPLNIQTTHETII